MKCYGVVSLITLQTSKVVCMQKPADIERKYLTNNPQKPYISCNYMHTMGNSGGGLSSTLT